MGDPWLCSGLWLYNAMCNLTAPHEVFIGERREKQLWRRAQEQRPQERATPAHPPLQSRRQEVGDRHWCHPGPFPRALGASALPAPRGSRDLPPAHGVETLVRVVSKRVTLERRTQDTLEVGEVPGTFALLCAQPLGPQQAGRRGAQFGGATPNPAATPHSASESDGMDELVHKDSAL